LFGTIDKCKIMMKLETDIYILKRSVYGYLYSNVYKNRFSKKDSAIWAMAVLNTLLITVPDDKEAISFYEKNEDKIWLESLQVKKYSELSGPSGGASWLYFAEMCFATDMMNEPNIQESIHDIMHKSLAQSKLDDDLSRRQIEMGRHNIRYRNLKDRADLLGIFLPSVGGISSDNNVSMLVNNIRLFTNIFMKYRVDYVIGSYEGRVRQ